MAINGRINAVYTLFKVRRAAFKPFAFFTFGYILNLAALKKGLHFNFAPAGTKKLLRCTRCTAVFTGLGHFSLLAGNPAATNQDYRKKPKMSRDSR
jgi:hypothetical protein